MLHAKQEIFERWRFASRFFSLLVMGIGLFGLIGWEFKIPFLLNGFTDGASIKVNSALSFILLGLSIFLLHYRKVAIARLLISVVGLICLLTLSEYLLKTNFSIENFLIRHASQRLLDGTPERMPLFTTLCLFVLVIAILIITLNKVVAAQLMAGLLSILVYASLIGNIYGIDGLVFQKEYHSIANHVILGLCFLSLALLLYCPTRGWIKLLSSQFAGGALARFTFSYFLAVAPIFIGFYLFTINRWQFSPGLSIISLFLLTCFITLPITYFYLQRLNALDSHLKKAHIRLKYTHREVKSRNEELQHGNRELAIMAQEVIKGSLDLENKNKELLRINKGLEFIVQMTSHDLKTPIYNIEILFEELRPTLEAILRNDNKIVHLMGSSIGSLKRTIDGLAQIIRSQQTIIGLQVNVSITKLIQEIQKDMERDIQFTNAEITLDTEVDVIIFSQIHLRSIFYNLINNALKYRSPDRAPVLTIQTRKAGKGVEIIFTDNGLGMNPKQLSQLFTIFKRFHSHVEGSGIGLYIVKETIENNGGEIKAESTEGVGTKFTIFLPQDMDEY